MTMSWKRLIAFVALIAIALAGTPTHIKANDGLNSQRYGFKSPQQQDLQVAEQIEANLNRNPFRDQTVTATLSGSSIQIDRATVAESSVARLLTEGTTDRRAIAAIAKRSKGNVTLHGELHAAVFSNQRGLFAGMINAGQSAMNVAGNLYDAAIDGVEVVMLAESGFANTVTAAATGYGVIPVRPANIQANARLSMPLGIEVVGDKFSLPVASAPPVANIQAISSSAPVKLASAVIRNIRTESIRSLPAAVKLKRPTAANISIEVLDCHSIKMPGEQLLIDDYVPTSLDSGKPAAALAVPAMMIGHSRNAAKDLVNNGLSTRAFFQSAKSLVKSVLRVIEPIIGLQRAMMIPQQIREQLFQFDDLIFSSSTLKHVWNVCGHQK